MKKKVFVCNLKSTCPSDETQMNIFEMVLMERKWCALWEDVEVLQWDLKFKGLIKGKSVVTLQWLT